MHIIACYIKSSTNQYGNRHMLDGIANSGIVRVLSNHYPRVCGRILWIILIVGQRLPSLPSLSHSGRFCEASTQSVSMWPICLVLKLQKFSQVFADSYNETFICKISLFVNSPKHRNFKVTVKLVWKQGNDLFKDLFDRSHVLLSLLRNKGRVIVCGNSY